MDWDVTDAGAVPHSTMQVMNPQDRNLMKDGHIGTAQLANFPAPHSVIGKQAHNPAEWFALSCTCLEDFPHLG